MSEYIWILIWVGFVALFARSVQVTKKDTIAGLEFENCYWLFAFLAFFPVIVMAGNRSYSIGDTWAYKMSFDDMPNSFSDLGKYMTKNTKDFGFYFLSAVFKIVISDDPRAYFWTIAMIQGLLLVKFYSKFSVSYVVSLFLFVVSGEYVGWMFNGIRQFLAVTIILLIAPYIIQKKYIQCILIILFAATIHQSALIVIPVIFVAQGDVWSKKTVIFVLGIMAVVLFLNQFTSLLNESLSITQYKGIISASKELGDRGTSYYRVIVYSIPAVLSLIFRDKINQQANVIIKTSVHMSIVSSGIYIVSMFTSGILVGRLPAYFSLFGYVSLPWIFREMFDLSIRSIVYSVMIAFYLVFYWFQMSVAWGLF